MKSRRPSFWHKYRTPLIAGGLVATLAPSIYAFHATTHETNVIDASCLKEYPLTSRSLDCERQDQSAARMQAVEQAITEEVAHHIARKHAARVSVWVRNLETRRWAATNETELYAPASMLKVPIMITYFKLAEIQPTILTQELTYVPAEFLGDSAQNIPSGSQLVHGKAYTIERLIEDMIVYSDNDAMHVLLNNVDGHIITKTMSDLGIAIPSQSGTIDFVTARSFANMFRSLYNASYLDRAHSQKALDLLSRSKYKPLAAGLPPLTITASKFGERVGRNTAGEVLVAELHDCGIVYATPDPYSICIMTQGTDLDELKRVVETISTKVYAQMN